MNSEQLERMSNGKGFIAALDQSGGSTPKALLAYGVEESSYSNEDEMFDEVHAMRTRIIKSPAFDSDYILAAILFKNTMNRKIDGKYTADFLWEEKGIIPILKVDEGLAPIENGVQLMKPFTDLEGLLKTAKERHVFGTKMRSVIKEANEAGIKHIVKQQFDIGKQICEAGLVPILEPEVDIHSKDKEQCEVMLKRELKASLKELPGNARVMFKLTIPTEDDFYLDLMQDPQVVRVVALSGGYSQKEANEKLAKNHGLIASFSRALAQDLSVNQSNDAFDEVLSAAIKSIYAASIA